MASSLVISGAWIGLAGGVLDNCGGGRRLIMA